MQPIYNTLLGRDPVLWLKAQLRQQQLTHGEEEEMPEHLCTELSFSRPALLRARLGIHGSTDSLWLESHAAGGS